MDRDCLDKWCERGILGLVLAILVFAPLATGAVRTVEFLIVQGLTIGVVLLWMARLWLKPRPHLFWPPICWAVLAFVGYALVRCQMAPIEYVARQELTRVLVYAFLFFAILNNLNRQESTQIVAVTLIGLAAVIATFAVLQFVTHYDRIWDQIKPEGYIKRGSGTFINPNHLAGFLGMILPLGLAYVLIGRLSHVAKVLIGYAVLLILGGIGVSMSRGGWVAVTVALLGFFGGLLFYRDFRLRALLLFLLLAVIGGGFAFKVEQVQKRVGSTVRDGELTDLRPVLWDAAIQIWKEDPWQGAGPGHYDYLFPAYRPPEMQARAGYAHNDYLNTLADWGMIGLALALVAVALFGVGVFTTWPHVQRAPNDFGTKQSTKAAFVYGGAFGIVAVLAHSVTDFNMQMPANAILAVSILALVSGYLRFATERFWVESGLGVKIFTTLICLAGVFYLGNEGCRRAREHVLLKRVRSETAANSFERIEALKAVFAIEPRNARTAAQIGEIFRVHSWAGMRGYEDLAIEAMGWFEEAMRLNPYEAFNFVRYGMCLAWLERVDEAEAYFERARELDPNGYYTLAHLGWHSFHKGDYAGAKVLFERSLRLKGRRENPIAASYLELVRRKLEEAELERLKSLEKKH